MKRFLAGLSYAFVSVCAAAPIDASKVALYDLQSVQDVLIAVGEQGTILRSRDQGRTWQATAPVAARALTALAFVDATHGVAVGHGGTVLRTADAGATWVKVPLPDTGTDALLGVTALRDGRFIAYGAFGLYVESADRGATWVRKKVVAPDFDRHISKVIQAGDKLLLVGESATLAVSSDGGLTWKALKSPYEGSLFGALVMRDGAWLVYGMRGNVYRSVDGGTNWTKVAFPAAVAINGGSVSVDGRVVLVGNNGVLAISVDNGNSFVADNVPQRAPLAQASYTGDGGLVYVGYIAAGRKEGKNVLAPWSERAVNEIGEAAMLRANALRGAAVADEFEAPSPDERWIVRIGTAIFQWRRGLLIVGLLITAAMGWSAMQLRVTAGFTKMIPLHHPFMQTFLHYQGDFGGADKVLIAIQVKQGDIFTKKSLDTVRKITDETFYIKGIERSSLTSMVTPNVRWNEVVEEGFKGGPLMSADFAGTPEQLEKVRQNLSKSDWAGRIVSNDMTTTLVAATLQDRDPETGERLDLRRVGAQLEDIRAKYEDQDLSLHIVGFAKASADIADGATGVLKYFLIAFAITAAMLFWYSRSAMLTGWVLMAASIPVVWLMGALPLLGLGLDPMSILVPFLIFAIGVSHAVQMTNAWKLETLRGADGVTASHNCFVNLFIPGATALLANAVGFIVIAIVDIEIVRELALTATIGVSVMIVTNKVLLPILLSYMSLPSAGAQGLQGKETAGNWLWERMGFLATKRGSLIPLAIGLALTAFGMVEVRGLKIGDLGTGVPELRADTRYNRDVATITSQFSIGLDVLQVIAEMEGSDSPCLKRELLAKVENFESGLRQVEGVAAVRGLASLHRCGDAGLRRRLGEVARLARDEGADRTGDRICVEGLPEMGIATRECNAIPLSIYPTNHQATTIKRIVAAMEDFKKPQRRRRHHVPAGLRQRRRDGGDQRGGGCRGDHDADCRSSARSCCCASSRSVRGARCCASSFRSTLVSVLCNALMATLGIGLKVSTLPVIALGVGVGVDYGIYLFERISTG